MTTNKPLPEELPVEEHVEPTTGASQVITAKELAAMQIGGGQAGLDVDALFAAEQTTYPAEGEQQGKHLRLSQRRRWYGTLGSAIFRMAVKILLPRFVRRIS